MNRDVPEANGSFQPVREGRRENLHLLKPVEGARHRVGRRPVALGDQVRGDVDTQLHGPRQIHTEDILGIPVALQLLDRRRALVLNSPNAPSQGLNFLLNLTDS